MRKFILLKRVIAAGFKNFFRNAWLSSAATAIMVVTLAIILSSFALNMILNDNINAIARRVTVSVFLVDGAPADARDELQAALEMDATVDTVRYISNEEAVRIYREQFQDNQTLLDSIAAGDVVLPASLEVTLNDLSNIDNVTAIADGETFADIVDETSVNEDSRQAIDNIARAQDFITLASIVAVSIFATISILVIFNTIRLTIFTRSAEIEIMKLIGATPDYIRGPFLFEASLYGVLAGLIATSAVYSGLVSVGSRASQDLYIQDTVEFFRSNWPAIYGATILLGVLIGVSSSMVALSRYLRLKRW